MFTHSPS